MSIAFSGTRSRSGGLISAIAKQVKLANLKPLKKVTVRFDPFHEHVKNTRDFLFYISGQKVLSTNYDCNLKTEVVCDSSDPTITLDFDNSEEKIIFKSKHLTSLEMLILFNKYVSSKVVPEVDEAATTKQKKLKKGGKK